MQSSASVAAVDWVQTLLTGSLASAVAIIAVAGCGLALLAGRIAWRDGARVLIGCTLIFGASQIAAGLLRLAPATTEQRVAETPPLHTAPFTAVADGDASNLLSVYQAAQKAVAIRFPGVSGTIHITATLASDGAVRRFDIRTETLDAAVTDLVGSIISASALRFPYGPNPIALPDLNIEGSTDPA